MCDFSLSAVASRPAKVGDKLVVKHFGTGTRGFAAPEDPNTAVCLLPGTEIAFDSDVKDYQGVTDKCQDKRVARFRQINKECPHTHHDCLEMADGTKVLLTFVFDGLTATVLQLPAAPKNTEEEKEQTRLEIAG